VFFCDCLGDGGNRRWIALASSNFP
jgi:hypothetical protein